MGEFSGIRILRAADLFRLDVDLIFYAEVFTNLNANSLHLSTTFLIWF
jgi:hypothetical protein